MTFPVEQDEDPSETRFAARYPVADITPAEFESFVADLLGCVSSSVENLVVTSHEVIDGVDGTFDFDATLRFRFGGMDFLIVVEAKRYTGPVKREKVQILRDKAISVGAQKAVLISTSYFQSGAIRYAKTHGIALVFVTEGRFTFETRAAQPSPPLTREQALEMFEIPVFVGVHIGPGNTEGSTMLSVIGSDDPERVREIILPGLPGEPVSQ